MQLDGKTSINLLFASSYVKFRLDALDIGGLVQVVKIACIKLVDEKFLQSACIKATNLQQTC